MSSESITDDPDKGMKDITPVVPEAPVIDWEGSIQNGFSFSGIYELMNGREYSNDGADASASSRYPQVDQRSQIFGHHQ